MTRLRKLRPREAYDAVQRTNGMSSDVLRRTLEDCASIRAMQAKLTDAGLLLEPGRRFSIRALWVLALLALFGAGVLWLAAPARASAWSVPRDAGAAGNGRSGGCGGGCGGCGGCGG